MQIATESGVLGQMFGHSHIRLMMRGIVIVLVVSSVMLLLDWGLRPGTMPVEEVIFKGRFKNVTHAQLEGVVARHLKNNFLMVNPEAIQNDIEKLPWIYRAAVRRKWPAGLYVEFMEQEPVAYWGNTAWLNSNGDIIYLGGIKQKTGAMSAFTGPTLTGPEKNSAQLLQSFNLFQKLFSGNGITLSKLKVSRRGSYRLTTGTGIEIVLGKQDIQSKLERFLSIYRDNLARHQGAFSRVDLRYTNGFAVLWNETASNKFEQNIFWGTYVKT